MIFRRTSPTHPLPSLTARAYSGTRHLLAQYALDGTETVFIDDVAVNLQATAESGIRSIQFESPGQCEIRLKEPGCL